MWPNKVCGRVVERIPHHHQGVTIPNKRPQALVLERLTMMLSWPRTHTSILRQSLALAFRSQMSVADKQVAGFSRRRKTYLGFKQVGFNVPFRRPCRHNTVEDPKAKEHPGQTFSTHKKCLIYT